MSSTIFSQQNPSPVQTRRTQTRNENAHKTNDRRSLSGKFRNLFRKNSASPTRTITNPEHLNPAASASPAIAYQRSTSPETISASTEAPHLRAPSVNWPFGKKKAKSPTRKNESTNGKTKTKTKDSKKNKKVTITPLEISGPLHHQQQQQEYQTLIHDQNFVLKTPEFPHGSIGRANSSPPYETTTKGFRDFMVIDHSNTSQQEMTSRADAITPLPYTSNHNYSPSMNHHRLPDTNIEYSYHQDTSSPPISDTEIFLTPKQRRKLNDTPSLTATQMLIENTPTRPVTSKFSPSKQHRKIDEIPSLTTIQALAEKTPIISPSIIQSQNSASYSTQWKSISSSSLNNSDTRSPTSSSIDVDIPKSNTPYASLGQTAYREKSKQPNSQSHLDDTYNSLSNISHTVQPNRSYTSTYYGSLPDTEIMNNTSLTSSKPTISNTDKYPGLSAIVHYHLNPDALHFNERPSKRTSPQRTRRFEASTTTLNECDQDRQRLSTLKSNSSSPPPPPPSTRHHDGYIRPLTPQSSCGPTEVTAIRVAVDGSHVHSSLAQSRTAYYNPPDTPATYRSSTTIFTKNKNDFIDGGELRTWSIHDTDDLDSHKKTSTAIHVERKYNNHDTVLPTITNEYQYNSRNHERETNRDEMQEENYIIAYEYGLHDQPQYLYDQQQYSNNRFSHNVNNDIISSYTRSPTTIERDKIYDRTTRSYQNLEHIQEPLNGKTPVENSDASLRHYILKRSDSYDGLGILISADAKTGLNPRIRDVELGSPGHRAGLRKDDRIIYVNGISAENRDFSEVLILVQEGLNNNNLKFSVIHESINF
ncbi:unnamed protein product [Rotaria magnacalcarata]|uniref:PDZ domain-containing protein n=1 Tax=Rotaria magnacalcarata TaxID=392030 RepID=A0A819R6L9_9BILA|nr:unnamed protein product [Rotaria magnacalcarata]CAF4047037.1 unnamed protein product [Rotaria magnacalcarata]